MEAPQPEVMYGWFSRKQASTIAQPHTVYWFTGIGAIPRPGERGPCVYLDPSGAEVVVTEVLRTKDQRPLWDDAVYVGEVTRHVRNLPAEAWL